VLYLWHSAKSSSPSVVFVTLGKEPFAECKKDTRQRNSLPSVKNKTLGKELRRRVFSFTDGFLRSTRQRASLPSDRKNIRQRIWHSAKSQILIVNSNKVVPRPIPHLLLPRTAGLDQNCLAAITKWEVLLRPRLFPFFTKVWFTEESNRLVKSNVLKFRTCYHFSSIKDAKLAKSGSQSHFSHLSLSQFSLFSLPHNWPLAPRVLFRHQLGVIC
jgi:hypothetical protein